MITTQQKDKESPILASAPKKELCGAVMADKPEGMPSTVLVACLRRELQKKRIGHTGILDRAASGLMLLLVGRATGFAQFFLHGDKEYKADFHFGKATDTHDREGQITGELPQERVKEFLNQNREKVENAVSAWIHLKEQHPPVYSALKQGGRRLSDHVRMGQKVETKLRPVRIYESKVLEYNPDACCVRVHLHVSGGTYVRSLARDLEKDLGIPIHLGALSRTMVGPHRMDSAAWQPEKNKPLLLSPQEILPSWPRMVVRSAEQREKILRGLLLPLQLMEGEAPKMVHQNFFIEDQDGQALAWAVRVTGAYRYRRILA